MKQEEVKELWELCGFKIRYVESRFESWYVIGVEGREIPLCQFPPDLNNLFKYAVSKRIDDKDDGYQAEITGVTLCPSEDDWWCELTYNWTEGGIFDHERIEFTAKEAADALGEACLKVLRK